MKSKILLFALIIIISLVVIFQFIVPVYKEAREISTVQIPAAQKRLAKEVEINKNISNLENDYEIYKDDLRTLKFVLPEGEDIESLLVQIEAIVLKNGVAYSKIKLESQESIPSISGAAAGLGQDQANAAPGMSSVIPQIKKKSVSLELSGPYAAILKIIEDLESLNRVNNVVSLEIGLADQNSSSEEGSDSIEAVLNIEVYYKGIVKAVTVQQAFKSSSQEGSIMPVAETEGSISP